MTFTKGINGKISWKKTIQNITPLYSNKNLVFSEYIISKSKQDLNSLITIVHQYCVYESFRMLGWLYNRQTIPSNRFNLKQQKKYICNILNHKINSTFNEYKIHLFTSMLNIVNYNFEDVSFNELSIGIYHFASVWERMIDYIYGESDKSKYLPKAQWYTKKDGKWYDSSFLIPDTIMNIKNNIYVLDAKYYRYGITENAYDLPNTSSIQKQITYAKHIDNSKDIDKPDNIFNAFILPYESNEKQYDIKFVAFGTSDWEQDNSSYSCIVGILIDTRHLIKCFSKHSLIERQQLSKIIEEAIDEYKNLKK